jgi:hypothetical protein
MKRVAIVAIALTMTACGVGSQPQKDGEHRGQAESSITDTETRVENFDDHLDIRALTDPDFGRLAFAVDGRPGLWLRNQQPSTSSAPQWGQVVANMDIYNIRDFGADPTGLTDSASAIAEAIEMARTDGTPGGVVYFPAGEYRIDSTVWLPRDPFIEDPSTNDSSWRPFVPISLVGAGVGATSVRYFGTAAGSGAFMSESVSEETARPTTAYRFERMSISCATSGKYAFAFTQQFNESPDDDPTPANDRAMYLAFRDMRFEAPNDGNDPVVYIRGAFNGSMENVLIHGVRDPQGGNGGIGLHLQNSTQWSLRDVQVVFQDGDLWKGILIEGGGQHILQNIRINATIPICSGSSCFGGMGLHIKRAQTLDLSTVIGEGFQGEHFVHVENSSDIHFKNLVTPAPKDYVATTLPFYGLYIDGDSRNITWSGGQLGSLEVEGGGHSLGAAIAIEDGAQDVRIDDVTYLGSSAETLLEPTTLDIPSDIRFEARIYDFDGYVWSKVLGASQAQTLAGNQIDARGLKVARINMPPIDAIVVDRIVYGTGPAARTDVPVHGVRDLMAIRDHMSRGIDRGIAA